MIQLVRISKGDPFLRGLMAVHYSQPKGIPGRSICYRVEFEGVAYGATVAGSATRFLPGRSKFFGCEIPLNNLVNNVFFHIEPGPDKKYPCRNFAQQVVGLWRSLVERHWPKKYGDEVLGWETLVEPPRTGELYLRDGWVEVGMTKGYTCKRTGGKGTDSWTGRRVWNTNPDELRPKRVFVRHVSDTQENRQEGEDGQQQGVAVH